MRRRSSLDCRRPVHGAGALGAVLLLYAAMAFVVAFLNRSLVLEQKTSANQYRATLAFEAAEAGLEWAAAMLNKSGRITPACIDSADVSDVRFRDRYLALTASRHGWSTTGASGAVVAACVASPDGPGWNCSCPAPGTAPTPTLPDVGGYKPSFAIAFVTHPAARAIDVVSYGCTSPITTTICRGDGAATVRVTLADVAALATPPGAALTVRGAVRIGNAAMGVHNGDPNSAGVTVNAGMGIEAAALRITSTPGTPPQTTLIGNDESLRSATEAQMFQTFFGMPKASWQASIADAILACPCTQSDVQSALARGARKLWLQGDLRLEANPTLGGMADPFLMVVDGSITMRGDMSLHGLIYSTAMTWDDTGAGNAKLVGAAISEGHYAGSGSPDYHYDPRVIDRLLAIPGAFVRVPGAWRDF